MANQFSSNLKSLTTRAITAGMKTLLHLFVIAVALFLVVGTAHAQAGPCPPGQFPCILVSDLATQQITVYPDAGCVSPSCTAPLNPHLLGAGGAGGGEGAACLSGSANVLYVANNSTNIDVYSMNLNGSNQAPFLNAFPGGGGGIAGLATNTMFLFAAEHTVVGSFTPLPNSPYLQVFNTPTTDPASHDVTLGVCPPNNPSCPYGGNVFTTQFETLNTGVLEFMPAPFGSMLTPPGGVQFLPGPLDGTHNCAVFANHTHCWSDLSGIVFDNNGNLWANSTLASDNGTFEFAPGGTCGKPVCALNFTPDNAGASVYPIGITVAPSTDPLNPGKILLANYEGSSVDIIDPHSCTGLNPPSGPWTLGTCTGSTFISDSNEPKYVVYSEGCPNPDNNGYLEICKQSNPNYPVTGTFDFTASAPQFSSGTIQVPVGECSGPVEVPSGQVTVTETPTIGDLVSNVTACSYNEFGECVPDLISWTLPDLYATVPVATGGVSSETLTTFTNYAASPGQLKVCKIAGLGTPVGTEFTFTVTGIQPFQVQAGPPGQGGYCQLVPGTFPVNTPVTIAETPNASYPMTSATVECNACTYSINLPQSSVTTTIGAGITVASFTNTKSTGGCLICRNPGIE